jgi:hypothetical protein
MTSFPIQNSKNTVISGQYMASLLNPRQQSKNHTRAPSFCGSNVINVDVTRRKSLILEKRQLIKDAKRKVAFGTTLDRSVYPHDFAKDRTGNEFNTLTGSPNRGPGVYENDQKSSIIYQLNNKIQHPCSLTGCYLNRTERRFFKQKQDSNPAPNVYQEDNTSLKEQKTAYRPFQSAVNRFREPLIDPMITPGPGSYEIHNLWRNRKITWPQMFCGRIDDKMERSIRAQNARTVFRTDQNELRQRIKRENRLAYFKLYFNDSKQQI